MKEYLFKGIEMEPMTLSFGVMLGFLQRAIAEIKDPRQASNATRYSIKDTVVVALATQRYLVRNRFASRHSPTNGSGVARDGSGMTHDGSGMTHDGSGVAHDGSGVARDGSGMTHDGSGVTRDGSGVTRDGSGVTRDGSGMTRDGSGVTRDGSGVTCAFLHY